MNQHPFRSRYDRQRRRARNIRTAIILILGFVLLTILDFPLLHLVYDPTHHIYNHDWFRLLRIQGFLGTWIAIAAALALSDRHFRRAAFVFLAPLAAAALAELLKLLIGRARPTEHHQLLEGWYHFRPFLSGFRDASNLGMPSSHAAAAFAGAFALAIHIPRLTPLVLALALGCAYTRVATGAHFPTDVYAAAVLSWITVRAMSELRRRIRASSAVPSPVP